MVLSTGSTAPILPSTCSRSLGLISVSPQVTDSKMASWRKIYCSCGNAQIHLYFYHLSLFTAYRSLHHLRPLVSHLVDGSCNVHHLLLLDLVQDIVYADEGTSTSNSSTVSKYCHVHEVIIIACIVNYLQCTSRGPLLASCWEMTFLWKDNMEVAYSGTPWSGQDV